MKDSLSNPYTEYRDFDESSYKEYLKIIKNKNTVPQKSTEFDNHEFWKNCEKVPKFEDLFKLPIELEFDIEIKYAWNLKQEYELNWEDRNSYIDEILRVVFENAGSRKLFFSCFCPDVCMLLRAKQAKFPVYFLCPLSSEPHDDIRSKTFSASTTFAKDAHLAGIVCCSEPLIGHLEEVKGCGTRVMTYGRCNNDTAFGQEQYKNGVSTVITDNPYWNYLKKGLTPEIMTKNNK